MIEIVFPDEWGERLAWITAVASMAIGLISMLFPKSFARLLGLSFASGSHNGISEMRSTFGGMWVGLGLACLLLAQPLTYFALGLAFAGAVLGRLISMIFDRSFNLHCLIATIVEALGCYFPLRFALHSFALV